LNNRSGKSTRDWPSDTRTMCACGTTLTGAENVNLTKPLRALALVLEQQSGEIPSDEEILEQIHAELAKVAWVPRDGPSITVKDGVVDLNGVILEEREREALRVVAENVAGVKAVEDHLVWIEPVSGIVIDPRQDERGSS